MAHSRWGTEGGIIRLMERVFEVAGLEMVDGRRAGLARKSILFFVDEAWVKTVSCRRSCYCYCSFI